MTPIIAGQQAASSQGVKFSYDPRTGISYGGTIRGRNDLPADSPNSIDWWINYLISSRIAYTYEQEGPIGTITITPQGGSDPTGTGQAERPIDNWQLVGNEIQKSWDQHPKSQAIERNRYGSLSVVSAVSAYLKSMAPFSGGTVPYSYQTPPPGLPATWDFGPKAADAEMLKTLLVYGSDHYADSQMVVRHSQTISDNYAYDIAHFNWTNVQHVYTPTELLNECRFGWVYNMPKTIQEAIQSMAQPAGMDTTAYLWGWRKLSPTATSGAYNKIEINTEYVLDGWSKFYYDAKT